MAFDRSGNPARSAAAAPIGPLLTKLREHTALEKNGISGLQPLKLTHVRYGAGPAESRIYSALSRVVGVQAHNEPVAERVAAELTAIEILRSPLLFIQAPYFKAIIAAADY